MWCFSSSLLFWTVCSCILNTCESCSAEEHWTVECKPWPEADQLFHRDTRWHGADAANSVDLGGGRVLWTFGDSFIDTNPDPALRNRRRAKFIRNSVGIQTGYDPSRAEFRAYWQTKPDGKPASFFRNESEVFFWPCSGIKLQDKLLIFLMRVRNSDASLGFSVDGWGAVLISNPQDEPKEWKMNFLKTPQNSLAVMVGSGSSIRQGDWIYSYGSDNSRRHNLYLTRVLVDDVVAGNFSSLQWRNGTQEQWIDQTDIENSTPAPILTNGQSEFTVHYESKVDSYLLTQFRSFPRSPIMLRESQHLGKDWTPGQDVFKPEEAQSTNKDTMLYAAKAHPEQQADGLAVTYCSNTFDLASVRGNEALYYPRFVRFKFSSDVNAQADSDTN